MTGASAFILILGLSFSAACRTDPSSDSVVVKDATVAATSSISSTGVSSLDQPLASVSPSPIPSIDPKTNEPIRVVSTDSFETRFPVAAQLIEDATERVSVTVITSDGRTYEAGDNGTFALASVLKVPLMIATLEQARRDERPLTTKEIILVREMITTSDNLATASLWESIGGGERVASLLEAVGLTGVDYAGDHQWGDSRSTSIVIAKMVAQLFDETSLLSGEIRDEALRLMRVVVEDQRWGASAGVDFSSDMTATLAIKNGWYPAVDGWFLNSVAAIDIPSNDYEGAGVHTIVVFSEGARTATKGVRMIELIAAAINHEIVSPALVMTPQLRIFPTIPLPSAPNTAPVVSLEPTVVPVRTEEAPVEPTKEAVNSDLLIILELTTDVLVPLETGLVGRSKTNNELTLWYEIGTADAAALHAIYAASMSTLGWKEITAPSAIILSKKSPERWVGFSVFPARAGFQLVQLKISPPPNALQALEGHP